MLTPAERIASEFPLPEGASWTTVCKTPIKCIAFGSMGDLRSFKELQDAVNCWKCKKATDPKKRLYYGGIEASEEVE